MIHLPLPTARIADVYPNCAKRTKDTQLRNSLALEEPRVFARSADYERLAPILSLYRLAQETAIHVTEEELGNLYERVLVKGGERQTYLAIRSSSPFSRCPLCAQRDVQTLDHYLPRASFPEFAVLPINLVPSCFECNHAKHEDVPGTAGELTFHPYYDDWSEHSLIQARIGFDDSVFAEFSVNVEALPDNVAERAMNHFSKLDLGTLYSAHASLELVQRKSNFTLIFDSSGPEVLRAEILRESVSRRRPFSNAWQPALYQALGESDEFINGGFRAIEA